MESEKRPGYLLYYMEGFRAIDPGTAKTRLEGTGLCEVLPMGDFAYCEHAGGPEDMGAGVCFASIPAQVLAEMKGEPQIQYAPKTQVWVRHGNFAVGYWDDDRKPGPQDLIRPDAVPGYSTTLEDGNDWNVPLVRLANGGTWLPQAMKRNAAGIVEYARLRKHKGICEATEEVYQTICDMLDSGESERNMDELRIFDIAEQALMLNYHVGPAEIALLDLFTSKNVASVVRLLADLPGLLKMRAEAEESKKNSATAGD